MTISRAAIILLTLWYHIDFTSCHSICNFGNMDTTKPKLYISWSPVKLLRISQEYLNSLCERFDVFTPDENSSKEEILIRVNGSHAILAYTSELMDNELLRAAGDNLKVLSIPSAGYDNLKTDYMKSRGIRVGLAGSAITNSAAEMALTLLLAASRKLVPLSNRYKSDPQRYFRARVPIMGLENTVIGIVGAGRIGQSVAKKVKQFAISRLLYYSRTEKDEMKILNGQLCSLETIARESDYLIVTLAYNENTDKIISKHILSIMKPNAVIVNVGRGGLIDQEALIDSLQKEKIGGAALDVTNPEPLPDGDHPLLKLDNVLISPHLGGLTLATERNVVDLAVKNIIAALENKEMPEELKL